MDKGLQMNWLQRIQAAHRYKTSKKRLILHKCKLFYYWIYNIEKKMIIVFFSLIIVGDDDKETMSISISTASSQDVESVVSEKISSFGVEIQNHMQANYLLIFVGWCLIGFKFLDQNFSILGFKCVCCYHPSNLMFIHIIDTYISLYL